MNAQKIDANAVWPRGWDEAEMVGLCHAARQPLADKLKWLEQMSVMVEHMHGQKALRMKSRREFENNEGQRSNE